jgi:FdhD protein
MTQDMTETRTIVKVGDDGVRQVDDWVVVEEPLEIRVGGEALAVIMRTPGHDIELAAGFALTEGIVRSAADLGTIRQCRSGAGSEDPDSRGPLNVVDIRLVPGAAFDPARLRRNLMASAACGLCGKASLEALATQARPVAPGPRVARQVLAVLPERLRAAQDAFGRTGALHASGLFDAQGCLRVCREDVGRHNALDKVIGRCLLDGLRCDDAILLVSGRTSFEILQKAAVAGIPVVCAISGPTTLAVETARAFNITLINFLRGRSMNIAAGPERVVGR